MSRRMDEEDEGVRLALNSLLGFCSDSIRGETGAEQPVL